MEVELDGEEIRFKSIVSGFFPPHFSDFFNKLKTFLTLNTRFVFLGLKSLDLIILDCLLFHLL